MRPFLSFSLILLFPLAVCRAQQATDQGHYHSEVLHLDYLYPSEFSPTPQVAAEMMDDSRRRAGEAAQSTVVCITTPFAAEHKVAGGGVEALFLIRVDLTCLKMPANAPISPQYLGNVAAGALGEGLSKFPSPTFTEPTAYKLASHDAS